MRAAYSIYENSLTLLQN